jgi:hypothetical protein
MVREDSTQVAEGAMHLRFEAFLERTVRRCSYLSCNM